MIGYRESLSAVLGLGAVAGETLLDDQLVMSRQSRVCRNKVIDNVKVGGLHPEGVDADVAEADVVVPLQHLVLVHLEIILAVG